MLRPIHLKLRSGMLDCNISCTENVFLCAGHHKIRFETIFLVDDQMMITMQRAKTTWMPMSMGR